MSSDRISEWLFSALKRVEKPSRYLGNEMNRILKDPQSVGLRMALAFPDIYEIAFSHLGLKILHSLINKLPEVFCERVYAPWVDLEAMMREDGIPLFTLETKTAVADLDVLGFSLQYELAYPIVLNMLELAGLPKKSALRNESHPLVLAGGPNTANPEPLAEFIDAFFLGEAEEVVPELLRVIKQAKDEGLSRKETLLRLARLDGIYVPSFFEPRYDEQGKLVETVCNQAGLPRPRRAVVLNLDAAEADSHPMTPLVEPVHNRYAVEVQRGCTNGCRFCQAGMLYRPMRQRKPETIFNLAQEGIAASGQESLGLLSLSVGEYACLSPLAKALFDTFKKERVSLSLPSMRLESLTPDLVATLKQERKTGFTLAPEAGTERLRRVLNKGNSLEDLERSLNEVFANDWNHVKLYFMIGLPTETMQDVQGIVDLARRAKEIARDNGKKNAKITVSVSNFVPKAITPFQWCAFAKEEDLLAKHQFLRDELRRLKVQLKVHDTRQSLAEALLARGDRRMGKVLERAFSKGARFDAWKDRFRLDPWLEALSEEGLSLDELLYTEKTDADTLAWDHLDFRVSREFLWKDYQRAVEEKALLNCAYGACHGCEVCDEDQGPKRVVMVPTDQEQHPPWLPTRLGDHVERIDTPQVHALTPSPQGSTAKRVFRLRYRKHGEAVFLGHLDTMSLFHIAFQRAKTRLRYSEGFHPKPKLSFGPALPLGVASEVEYFDADVLQTLSAQSLKDRLNAVLPDGFTVLDTMEIPERTRSLGESISRQDFQFTLSGPLQDRLDAGLRRLESDEPLISRREKKGRVKEVDLREGILSWRKLDEELVEVSLANTLTGAVKPSEVLALVFELTDNEQYAVRIKKSGVGFTKRRPNKESTRNPNHGQQPHHQRRAARSPRRPGGERQHR